MPNFYDCLQTAMDGGEVDKARGSQMQRDYQELLKVYLTSYPQAVAETLAKQDALAAAKTAATKRRHTVLAQLQVLRRERAGVLAAKDKGTFIRDAVEHGEGHAHKGDSVSSQQRGLRKSFHGMIAEFLTEQHRTILGKDRDVAMMKEVTRALTGEVTTNTKAALYAKAIDATFERGRGLFNAFGGDIKHLKNRGVAHTHNRAKIAAAGFEKWANGIYGKLAWDLIPNNRTGKMFAYGAGQQPNKAEAISFLKTIYNNITTEGWASREPGFGMGGKSLANRQAEHRVLHFKNADAWLGYNDAFGTGTVFQAIMNQIDGMARDIALLKVLGPNPKATMEFKFQVALDQLQNAGDSAGVKKLSDGKATTMAIFAHATGAANEPASAMWAAFFGGTRNILQAAKLGSAPLSMTTDTVTLQAAAGALGMNRANMFARQMSMVLKASTRAEAARMGYVADSFAEAGSTQARYMGETWSPEITSIISNAVHRVSFLTHLTDAHRNAFRMEFSGHLAEQAHLTFAQLPKPLHKLLEGRGITAADWDMLRLREHQFVARNGANFISPLYWLESHRTRGSNNMAEIEGLSARLSAILEEQVEIAVPSVTLEGRARFLGEAQPGTFLGELGRSSLAYKGFAVSLMLNQWRRIAAIPTWGGRAIYISRMAALLTMAGALSVQLKEVAKGRDPRDMSTKKFWGAAFLQGGGLGIFGDFLNSSTSRSGGGFAETLVGPVAGLFGDVSRAVFSNASAALTGGNTHMGRDAVNVVKGIFPGSTLWYTRLAADRMLWDNLQDFLDPEAKDYFRQAEQRQRREYGNASFWPRGQASPTRGPDLAAAFGGAR